jgi:hypothetical protein
MENCTCSAPDYQDENCPLHGRETQHDSWDDPKYVKPADCDELGYCVDCGSATVHRDGCIVLTGNLA